MSDDNRLHAEVPANMDQAVTEAITALLGRLTSLGEHDEGLRNEVRTIASFLISATDRPVTGTHDPLPHTVDDGKTGEEAVQVAPECDPDPIPMEPASSKVIEELPLPKLTLGQGKSQAVKPQTLTTSDSKPTPTDSDLPRIQEHCRLKADGLRWAAARKLLSDKGSSSRTEIARRDKELFERARATNCFLWMNAREFLVPKDLGLLESAAGQFDIVANALSLIGDLLGDELARREFLEPALNTLAGAQSALRVAVGRIGRQEDCDQRRVYEWLYELTNRDRIYIPRHMRLEDPADPSNSPDLDGRLKDLKGKLLILVEGNKKKKKALNRIRYHADRILADRTVEGGEDDWRTIMKAIDGLVTQGTPPSDLEIREKLLPIVEDMPDLTPMTAGFRLVLREIDKFLASQEPTADPVLPDEPTNEVAEVGRLLKGKSVLLIGGVPRPGTLSAIRTSFNLEKLIWPETREHESITVFEPHVKRAEVALVLLAIRWSSHSYGDVKKYCDRHDKPMVRLPGGYGVNQIAVQILEQCGDRLRKECPPVDVKTPELLTTV